MWSNNRFGISEIPEVLGSDTAINIDYGTCANITGAPLSVAISTTPYLIARNYLNSILALVVISGY